MNHDARTYGAATLLGRASATATFEPEPTDPAPRGGSPELARALAEVKGQAQFLLYLADQLDDSLQQLGQEGDPGHSSFLRRVIAMYAAQLESKHQALGDRISEASQEIYIALREFETP